MNGKGRRARNGLQNVGRRQDRREVARARGVPGRHVPGGPVGRPGGAVRARGGDGGGRGRVMVLGREEVPDGRTPVHADRDNGARELRGELGCGVAEELDHRHAQAGLEHGDQPAGDIPSRVVGQLGGAIEVVRHG